MVSTEAAEEVATEADIEEAIVEAFLDTTPTAVVVEGESCFYFMVRHVLIATAEEEGAASEHQNMDALKSCVALLSRL
jgi:hypothetical protein